MSYKKINLIELAKICQKSWIFEHEKLNILKRYIFRTHKNSQSFYGCKSRIYKHVKTREFTRLKNSVSTI